MAISSATRCVIVVVLVVTILGVLMVPSSEAKPRGFDRAYTRNSWKTSKTSSRKSCLTDRDTAACGMGGRGWLQNLSECCSGYKCVYVIKKVNTFSNFKPTPVCRKA